MSNYWQTGGQPAAPQPTASQPTTPRTLEERQAILARVIQTELAAGGRIESQTPTSVVIVRGNRVNHILHLLITIFTIGLWVIVWILLAASGGEKRRLMTVDDYGNVSQRAV
jgi:hypothetical protein